MSDNSLRPGRASRWVFGWVVVLLLAFAASVQAQSTAQKSAAGPSAAGPSAAGASAAGASAAGPAAAASPEAKAAADLGAADKEAAGSQSAKLAEAEAAPMPAMDLWQMYRKGGLLMYPITFMSLVVVAFAIERAIALRRKKIIPRQLVKSFGDLADAPNGFDPRRAYRICQQMPCSASNVIRAVLLRVGRPHPEVERTAAEASNRETWKLYRNIRPLSLAVTVTPLMGLLGTLQGMIIVFFRMANSPVGEDRVLVLSDGIYLKLITAFSGLLVAVPALFLAHYYEGRVQLLMHDVDDLVESMLPQVEKYEGRLRVSRQSMSHETAAGVEPPPPPVARYVPPESVPQAVQAE